MNDTAEAVVALIVSVQEFEADDKKLKEDKRPKKCAMIREMLYGIQEKVERKKHVRHTIPCGGAASATEKLFRSLTEPTFAQELISYVQHESKNKTTQ